MHLTLAQALLRCGTLRGSSRSGTTQSASGPPWCGLISTTSPTSRARRRRVAPGDTGDVRPIFEAHHEAFRGSWDFREATENDFTQMINDPLIDTSMWKIAWAGDTIVGQVKSFINVKENLEMGYPRGYTEYISTHVDWRNKGIAGALLAASLHELKARGMTEAALGVDTENPGGAFQLYTKLGFELHAYEAAYAKPLT